jgi:hypothetical protein
MDALIVEHTITLEGAGHLVDEMGQEKVRGMLHKQFQAVAKTLRKKVGHTDVATGVRKAGGAMVAVLTLTLRRAGPLLDRMTEDQVRKDFEDALSPIGNLLKERLETGVVTTTTIRRQT